MTSYWEQESFLHYDHIVVGAGISGLSTALELKALYPNQRVLVLERGLFPFGASTRNAGFACIGSVAELLDDLAAMPEEEVFACCAQRQEGLRILRGRLGDHRIDFHTNGSHELVAPQEVSLVERIDWLNERLQPLASKNTPIFRLANERIKPFGFPPDRVAALVENTAEGELHTGKMMRALVDLALSNGIELKTGATVTRFEERPDRMEVFVVSSMQQRIGITCAHLFFCTNAFTPALLPNIAVEPGRGQVMVTSPISNIPFKGIFHADRGYYYFREIDGRVLMGGGRNLDFARERTTEIAINHYIQSELENMLRKVVLPGRPFTITHRWAGIMAFGPRKGPIIQSFGPRVHGAFRFGGMGVALSSFAAKKLVALV